MRVSPNSNEEHSSNSHKEEIFDEFNDDFSEDGENSLTVAEFSNLTFGTNPLEFDPTDFVCGELDVAKFFQLVVEPMLQNDEQGILRNLFPYLIDLLNRTVTFDKIATCIKETLKIYSNPTLKKLEICKGRDYLAMFLDHIPDKSLPKMLGTLVSSNIPIPLLLTKEHQCYEKGLRVLSALRDIVIEKDYCLLLVMNLTTSKLENPFSKQLYPALCKNREKPTGVTFPGSIDITFHPASENKLRRPIAIAEAYNLALTSDPFQSIIKNLSKEAFFIILNTSEIDFIGSEPTEELGDQIESIARSMNGKLGKRFLVLYTDSKSQPATIRREMFKQRKHSLETLFHLHNDKDNGLSEFYIKVISPEKMEQNLEDIKENILVQLPPENQQRLYPPLGIRLPSKEELIVWSDTSGDNTFARSMTQLGFQTGVNGFRRAQIFPASNYERKIENLNDKRRLSSDKYSNFISEEEIDKRIKNFKLEKALIGDSSQISALKLFSEVVINKNFTEMKNFARDIDSLFKTHLQALSSQESKSLQNPNDITREQLKREIEDNDISIHDFWREFVILSMTKYNRDLSVLEKLYSVKPSHLQDAYKTWVIEGEAMQILDGLSLRALDPSFLSNVLSSLMSDSNRRLIVISVIGLESSGKSTLLNYLFKCGFSTSAGRCTKGMYMSYRHSDFKGIPFDLLILDSEGMSSTAQKYITRRSSFDKKITLLALMCSQIVIINTKGLTKDISNILEVSSYHLDALSKRKSKPRLHFVLRDMMDSNKAQKPAFDDIRESLEEMFRELPGCTQDLSDFMTISEEDVHLLVNAFTSFHDDLRPKAMNMSETEHIHLPTESFPLIVSNLRKLLISSALDHNDTGFFENVHGFIIHMNAMWETIDARGSFLHFENFKTIQKWNLMQNFVEAQRIAFLEPFKKEAIEKMKEKINKLRSNLTSYIEIKEEYQEYLKISSDNFASSAVDDFFQKVGIQIDDVIKDEGKTLICGMFMTEKLELEAKWREKELSFKEKALINNAEKTFNETIQRYNTLYEAAKLQSDQERTQKLFNEAWGDVESFHKTSMENMVLGKHQLQERVVDSFNRAIQRGQSNVKKHDLESKMQFERKFWMKLEKPATLQQYSVTDLQEELFKNIEIKTKTVPSGLMSIITKLRSNENEKQNMKNKAAMAILDQVSLLCETICSQITHQKILRNEYDETFQWLRKLSDGLFYFLTNEFNTPNARFVPELNDFNIIEKFYRWQIYATLEKNNQRWHAEQAKKLQKYKDELQINFRELVKNNFSFHCHSKNFSKHIINQLEITLITLQNSVQNDVDEYIKRWVTKYGATNEAHQRSFGKRDKGAARWYINNQRGYLKHVFNEESKKVLEEIKKKKVRDIIEKIEKTQTSLISLIDEDWCGSSSATLEEIISKHKHSSISKNVHEYVENFSFAGSCRISKSSAIWDPLKRDLASEFKLLLENWKRDANSRVESDIKNNIRVNWDKVEGCPACCPVCKAKCELPQGDHTHETSTHILAAFGGYRGEITGQATLVVCSETAARDKHIWWSPLLEKYVGINELMQANQPPWKPMSFDLIQEEQAKNMRYIWWYLRKELCEKYDMIDSTPSDWERYSR
ncbi:hypothetical protein G9A89_002999 [Geosiphon pyriformis]|nr:hypothetical protein G9A89_002999 [Geosiphon pyriformis]